MSLYRWVGRTRCKATGSHSRPHQRMPTPHRLADQATRRRTSSSLEKSLILLFTKFSLCLPGRATMPHPFRSERDDLLRTLLHQNRLRNLARRSRQMIEVVVQHQLVDVDLGDARRNKLLHQLGLEAVGAVQRYPNLALHCSYQVVHSVGIKLRACGTILAMNIPDRRRQHIDARRNEIMRLLNRRLAPLKALGVHDTILPTFNPTGLGLRRDLARVAVRDQFARLGQVLLFLEVRHVDHDAVERQRVGRAPDQRLVLRVVQVDRDGHRRVVLDRVRRRADQKPVGPGYGPREELEDQRGTRLVGGADEAEDLLDVVGDGGEDAVPARLGGAEDLEVWVGVFPGCHGFFSFFD